MPGFRKRFSSKNIHRRIGFQNKMAQLGILCNQNMFGAVKITIALDITFQNVKRRFSKKIIAQNNFPIFLKRIFNFQKISGEYTGTGDLRPRISPAISL